MNLIKKELGKITTLRKNYALDVACGDGRVTRELLLKAYNRVDLFD